MRPLVLFPVMKERLSARSPEIVAALAFALLAVLTFCVQYVARGLDDNRLTSWGWIFSTANPAVIAALIGGGCIVFSCLSRWQFLDRRPAAFLFAASFAVGALFWGEPEVIVDAARYFTQAKHLELYGPSFFLKEWGRAIPAWTDLPLLPFLYGLLFSAFGESRIWVQFFTTALFSLTVVSVYLLGRELRDEDTGLLGGLLLLGMPYLLTQIPLMLVDVGTMCLYMLAVVGTLLALRRGGFFLLAAPPAIAGAVLSKYSTWPELSVLVIVFAVLWKNAGQVSGDDCTQATRRSILRRGMIVATGAALLIGAFLFLFRDVVADQVRLLRDFQRPGLARWGESHLSTFCFQIHPLITSAALFSVYAAVRKRDLHYLIIGWTVFLLLVLRIERIRYLMTAFPLLALMAAYGIREMEGRALRRTVAFSIVAGSLAVALFAYLPFLKTVSTANLKAAGAYLDTRAGTSVEVITLSPDDPVLNPAVFVPILDLHTKKNIFYPATREHFPPQESIERSPLRFTWEYRDPPYYAPYASVAGRRDIPVVVISSFPGQPLPEHLKKTVHGLSAPRVFDVYEGVFVSRVIVTVYLPD